MSWVDVDISKFTYIKDPNFLDIFYEESLLATPGTTEDYLKLETTDSYKEREAVDLLPSTCQPEWEIVKEKISDNTIEEKNE
jgi:hypothetical protein